MEKKIDKDRKLLMALKPGVSLQGSWWQKPKSDSSYKKIDILESLE